MGNPASFYKRMLQNFAYSLAFDKSEKLAKQIYDEQDVETLENFIKEQRNNIENNMFFFNAGRASEVVVCEVEQNEGNDAFNACVGGLCEFMDFLELYEEK